jgi:hypothetical protein
MTKFLLLVCNPSPTAEGTVAQISSADDPSARYLEDPVVSRFMFHTRCTQPLASLGHVPAGKDSYCS